MFQIASNPATQGKDWTNPVYVAPNGVVGALRASEAIEFDTKERADAYLAGLRADDVRFYSLAVIEKRQPRFEQGNGWMKGHPGYDLA